jgi:transposase-like protein
LLAAGFTELSQREAARQLGCDEKTLRRWRHPACGLDLAPDEIRVLLRGLAVQRSRIQRTG